MLKKFFVVNIVIACIIFVVGVFNLDSFSSGERYGQITKISTKGIFCKTHEGELFTQSSPRNTRQSTNSFGTYFQFSVKDEAVLEKIKKAATSGKNVALQYEQEVFNWPCEGDTKYFATGVTISGE